MFVELNLGILLLACLLPDCLGFIIFDLPKINSRGRFHKNQVNFMTISFLVILKCGLQ